MNSLIFSIIIFVVEIIIFIVGTIYASRLEGMRRMVAASIVMALILFVSALSKVV